VGAYGFSGGTVEHGRNTDWTTFVDAETYDLMTSETPYEPSEKLRAAAARLREERSQKVSFHPAAPDAVRSY
jgi:hypothetical protein